MKKMILFLSTVMSLFGSCITDKEAVMEGTLEGIQADSIYLYQVINEHYGVKKQIKAIPVAGNRFRCSIDTLQTALYCLSPQSMNRGEYVRQSANLFLEAKDIQVSISKNKYDKLEINASGSDLQEKYEVLQIEKYKAGNREVLDSLDYLFYTARENKDSEEMERIREISSPYYTEASEQTRKLIENEVERNKNTLFGLYLYYSYRFQNHTFNTMESIEEIRSYISGFDEQCRQSVFFTNMSEELKRFARCAVGSLAPDITGKDLQGNVTGLKDFRGQYVLVDFWFAGCHWCRLEAPYQKKTYNAFKDSGFTILGVSVDSSEEDWKQAIEEDGSYWNHILVDKKDIQKVQNDYCIVGYPHIILVDPEGNIVAKELRGDEIYSTVDKFINSTK